MKKVLIVDLDGTLYAINTFHFFMKYLVVKSMKKCDVSLFVSMLWLVFLRGLKVIPHAKMKYHILKAINDRTYIDYEDFVKSISKHKRHIEAIDDANFDLKILATAAPSCYAQIIANQCKFDACVGTEFNNEGFNIGFENIKEVKKNSVVNYIKSLEGDFEISTVITDHLDDLPLLKLAKQSVIVNPDDYTERKLKENSISYKCLKD